jgi:hypothetical protein
MLDPRGVLEQPRVADLSQDRHRAGPQTFGQPVAFGLGQRRLGLGRRTQGAKMQATS